MPRRPDEIADDVAKFGLTEVAAQKLVNSAAAAAASLRRSRPNVEAIKAGIKEDRQWLLKRGNRRAREFSPIGFGPVLARLYSAAAGVLREEYTGPGSRFRWFDHYCARVAYDVIARSRDRRFGPRLRELAGLLYEAGTGKPKRSLETACRAITAEKKAEAKL